MVNTLEVIKTTSIIVNPYLEEFGQQNPEEIYYSYTKRRELVKKYSWAIPNPEAIAYLVSQSPIIEMGAGTGYWAKMILDSGGLVVAFDESPYNNHWCKNQWSEIEKINNLDILANYPEYTLFLCWPPYDRPFAYDCLRTYKGNKVVYVGEGYGGCTGDDNFHELLDEEWELVHSIDIPQWFGMHDYLYSYVRKGFNVQQSTT